MKQLARILVDLRYVFAAVMLAVTMLCGFLALGVEINTDMTRYLPAKSPMRKGVEILETAFPDPGEQSAFRFVFTGLDESEIPAIRQQIADHIYVSRVEYVPGNVHYNKDGRTLFIVNLDYGYDSRQAETVQRVFTKQFQDYDFAIGSNEMMKTEVPLKLLAIGVSILIAILVLMSRSWIEPVLFLIAIGMAVIINLGTNLVPGYISDITFSIAPVLQLVLSMDYSIILMNRYREEKKSGLPKKEAMKSALEHSFSSIFSSSFTTVVGLLALVFMTFKIGRELGIVLAKGVFISMICVFTVLPTLILWGDRLVEKTAKRTIPLPTRWLAFFSEKARHVIPFVFVAMFALFFWLRSFTPIIFTENLTDDLSPVFPADNTVVLLYQNQDEGAIWPLILDVQQNGHVRAVQAYANSFEAALTLPQITEAMSQMGGGAMPQNIIESVFHTKGWGDDVTMTLGEFMDTLTLDDRFADAFGLSTERIRTQMREAFDAQRAQMRGPEWSRLVIYTDLPDDSEETTAFMDELYARCDRDFTGETYLIGTSAMVHEMANNFSREFLTVSLITAVAIFLVVLLTFRAPAIPLILVLLVQCGVYMAITAMGWQGYDVYYLALLVVQGILMGATIDYAIVFSSYYKELRRTMARYEALCGAYEKSIHTIMTSGLILILVTAILGKFCPTQSIAQVCTSIALGSLSAVLLILFILPGLLACFDRLIVGRQK
jgi:predicted RND superfamily exporter protein